MRIYNRLYSYTKYDMKLTILQKYAPKVYLLYTRLIKMADA